MYKIFDESLTQFWALKPQEGEQCYISIIWKVIAVFLSSDSMIN